MKKFAIIGCGHIAKAHAEQIQKVGELTAVCDSIPESANQFARSYRAKPYYSLDDLLKSEPEIDIICVCSPTGLHAEHTIKSLQFGKHVLCEEPLCITGVAAWQMNDTAYFNRKKLLTVARNRYNETIKQIKTVMDNGQIGKIQSFQISCFLNSDQTYSAGDWKGTLHLEGGLLYSYFHHYIHLLYLLVGDVDTISGYRSAYLHRKNSEIEDTGAAVLKMVNGAVGTINYTINSPKTIGSFTLIGEKGSITVEGWDLTNLKWEGPAPLTMSVPAEISSSESSNINKTSINYYTELYNELYASLERPVDPMETRQAVKTIEIIEKFYACTKEI